MPRAHRSVTKRKRHKKWINRAKGYRGRRKSVFKLAKEAVLKAGQYAYRDRRKKKAVFRSHWHAKINAAARNNGMSYSQLMHQLKTKNIALDRKTLADLAENHPEIFNSIIKETNKSAS